MSLRIEKVVMNIPCSIGKLASWTRHRIDQKKILLVGCLPPEKAPNPRLFFPGARLAARDRRHRHARLMRREMA